MAEFQPKVYKHRDGRTRRVTSVESKVKAEFDGFAATDEKVSTADVGLMTAPAAPVASGDAEQFDPSQHTVPEVQDYLSDVDYAEAERVLAAERAGKNRQSIVG